MYIKYLNNIHNIDNYYSVGIKDNCIHLMKNDSLFLALEFKDSKIRNVILSDIWEEMLKKTEFLNIDANIELYNVSDKYNL